MKQYLRHYKAMSKDKFGCEFEYDCYITEYGTEDETRLYCAMGFETKTLKELKEIIGNL